jgi:hypothetical protein
MAHRRRAIILTTLSKTQEVKTMAAELEGQSSGPDADRIRPTRWTRRFGASGKHARTFVAPIPHLGEPSSAPQACFEMVGQAHE